MGVIKVNFGQLSAAADHLGQTANKIQDQLHQLEQTLKPLVSSWEGGAQESYNRAQAEWNKAAQNLHEITSKMGIAVNAANEAFNAGEKANTQRFGG